jgi:DNA-binding transcriptional ArsR family regulator
VEYDRGVPRAATTSDVFNAVAEPRRREILDALAEGEASVNELVERLHIAQPQVSKHLNVLRTVDLVTCTAKGKQRMYRLNARPLRRVHEWVRQYEQQWNERLDRFDDYMQQLQQREDPQ